MKELTVEAALNNLDAVMNFINDELEAGGCNMKTQTQINIAVEEVFVNIAHYAYFPEVGSATIRITAGDTVAIEFEDQGTPFNPLDNADPDIAKSAEQREIGGLGVFMVKQIMDSVKYQRADDKNILTISKAIC